MSTYESLFLSKFNPCADRVDTIDLLLHEKLDEHSTPDLIDHLETCHRCRRYREYMEAVERGFREHHSAASVINPAATRELPTALQDEMYEAMKRNLSRWVFEVGRGMMFKAGYHLKFFRPDSNIYSINTAHNEARNLLNSICGIDNCKEEMTIESGLWALLNRTPGIKRKIIDLSNVQDFIRTSLQLKNDNMKAYTCYYQTYMATGDYKQAKRVIDEALKCNPSNEWKSVLFNCAGTIFQITHDFEGALNLYKSAVDIYEMPGVHLNIGISFIEKFQLNEAVKHISRALAITEHLSTSSLRKEHRSRIYNFLSYNYTKYKKLIITDPFLNNLFVPTG